MAAPNAIAKTWDLPVAWNGRRYSDAAKVPEEGGGGVEWAQNRPPGLSMVVDRQWNPTDSTISGGVLPPASLTGTDSSGMQWFAGGGIAPIINTPASIGSAIGQSVPALPDGNATCMAIRYPSGFPAGDTPFGIFVNAVPLCSRMYHCAWVLMPDGFDSSGNNIKWLFFAQNGSDGRNHVWMLSSGDEGNYIGPWLANQGGGGSDNIGGASNTKSGAIVRAAPPSTDADGYWDYRQGKWLCIEWLCELESDPGVSSDGVFRAWFDGTLVNHFSNIRFNAPGDPAGFDTASFTPYYGGGGGSAPSDQYLLVGRFLVAGDSLGA